MPRRNLSIQTRFKIDFLDTDKIKKRVPREVLGPLARSSGFIRKTAKRSMRKRRGASPAGSPPYVHEGSLKRLIFFGYDRRTNSFVIGPQSIAGSPVPSVLEHGGSVRVANRRPRGKTRKGRPKKISSRVVKIEARPFMAPALDVAIKEGVVDKNLRTRFGSVTRG